jgi:hypothetical protein
MLKNWNPASKRALGNVRMRSNSGNCSSKACPMYDSLSRPLSAIGADSRWRGAVLMPRGRRREEEPSCHPQGRNDHPGEQDAPGALRLGARGASLSG